METDTGLRFEAEREAYEHALANKENVVYTAALYLPHAVKPLCEQLLGLAAQAESVNVLNPISTYYSLNKLRAKLTELTPKYQQHYSDCLNRLAQPVEGVAALDIAWVQGFTSANGTAAILELNSAFKSVAEALDRKAAYAIACFSLYIATISLVATTVFGWLSLV